MVKGKTEKNITKKSTTKKKVEPTERTSYFVTTCKCLAIIFLVPPLLNFGALIQEERLLKPEGDFIEVKPGQKLYKFCAGAGLPTVILDAPIGESSDIWTFLFPALAKVTKVCMYDRAGLGFSDRPKKIVNNTRNGGQPHTVETMVEDFHVLFKMENIPLLLVGADIGSVVAKFYAQMFPSDVAGIVYINPLYEGLFLGDGNPWNKFWFNSLLPILQMRHFSAALGLTRLGLQTGLLSNRLTLKSLPDAVARRQCYLQCKPAHVSSIVEEHYFLNETLSQARVFNKLRSIPADLPRYFIWSSVYNDVISPEHNQIWQKSRDAYINGLTSKDLKTSRLKGSLNQILLEKHQNVNALIIEAIKHWRKISRKY